MKYILSALLSILISRFPLIGQSTTENNLFLLEENSPATLEDLNETGQEEIPEELIKLINNPININSGESELLSQFNLINHFQFNSLKDYIHRNGELIELEELQQIEGFDKEAIQAILPYVTVRKSPTNDSPIQLLLRFQKKLNTAPENYLGSSDKILLRLKAPLSNNILLSFTGEKDPGEPLFPKNKSGFDFNSMYIIYNGKSIIRKIIFGDFIAQYGQGLTIWQGLNIGSGSLLTGIYKTGRGLIPYSGTDENRYLRGIGISTQKKNLMLDVWISSHKIDATKIDDEIGDEQIISSLQTSGYHRSDFEKSAYHSLNEICAGTTLRYSIKQINIGIVTVCGKYNLQVAGQEKPYSHYYFKGTKFQNTGFFFDYTFKNIFLFGESTIGNQGAIANIFGTILSLDPRMSLGLIFRNYPKEYMNLKSGAFGENTYNNNETGNFIGVNYTLLKSLTYSLYLNIYSFPYLKYRVDNPSHGFSFFNQLEYTPGKKLTAQFRTERKMKQQNEEMNAEKLNLITESNLTTYRFSLRIKIDNSWELAFRTAFVIQSKTYSNKQSAGTIGQSVYYHPLGKRYSANIRYTLYNCPTFDTRIYEYENDLPGSFSIPFYYGRGSRFYINLVYRLSTALNLAIRYSISIPDPANTTLDRTSEIKLQLKAMFR